MEQRRDRRDDDASNAELSDIEADAAEAELSASSSDEGGAGYHRGEVGRRSARTRAKVRNGQIRLM